jgi:hypothetical protein
MAVKLWQNEAIMLQIQERMKRRQKQQQNHQLLQKQPLN